MFMGDIHLSLCDAASVRHKGFFSETLGPPALAPGMTEVLIHTI
jgi:hypothetical protein